MKIFINTDLEGVSGFARREYIASSLGRPDLIAEARKLLAGDVNACIAGCFRCGVEAVTVRDGHAGGGNLKRSEVDDRADFIDGPMGNQRFSILRDYDAFIQLGVHSMANTHGGILEHTFNSSSIQNVWLNGERIGEIGILAKIAAEYEVPNILVTGDDKACAEARAILPEIISCEVKKGYSCYGGFFPPLSVTRKLIEEKTEEAIQKFRTGKIPVCKPEYPCVLRREMVERNEIPCYPSLLVIDSRTVEVEAESLEKAYFLLFG